MNSRLIWTCLLSLVFFCGCSKPITWNYTLGAKNGNTVLDMTGVAFIFVGETMNGGAAGTETIWAPTAFNPLTAVGSSSSSSGSGRDKFDCQYAKKVQTMSFRGHTIAIKDAGRKVEIDGQAFELKGNKKTFLIPKTGKVSVRDYSPQDYASPVPGTELIEPTPVRAK